MELIDLFFFSGNRKVRAQQTKENILKLFKFVKMYSNGSKNMINPAVAPIELTIKDLSKQIWTSEVECKEF